MMNNEEKQSRPADTNQPINPMASANVDVQKSTEVESTESKGKDESESYSDYNGNSEQNAPAKSRQ